MTFTMLLFYSEQVIKKSYWSLNKLEDFKDIWTLYEIKWFQWWWKLWLSVELIFSPQTVSPFVCEVSAEMWQWGWDSQSLRQYPSAGVTQSNRDMLPVLTVRTALSVCLWSGTYCCASLSYFFQGMPFLYFFVARRNPMFLMTDLNFYSHLYLQKHRR